MQRSFGRPKERAPYRTNRAVNSTITEADLLLANADTIRGSRCAWAPVQAVKDVLGADLHAVVRLAKTSNWCSFMNGHICAKELECMFAEIVGLLVALTSEANPLEPRQVLITAGWQRYGLAAYKADSWLPFLMEQGYLVREGALLLVTDRAYDAVVAEQIIAMFRS